LFAFITQNWHGKPLIIHEPIRQFIGSTTTTTGLEVRCCLEADCPRQDKLDAGKPQLLEPPGADPYAGWCVRGALNDHPLSRF